MKPLCTFGFVLLAPPYNIRLIQAMQQNFLFSQRKDMHEVFRSNLKGLSFIKEKSSILILFLKQHVIFSEGMKLLTLESHIPIDGLYEFQWLVKLQ